MDENGGVSREPTMGFRYFRAPEADMVGLLPGNLLCDICGVEGRCFDMDRAIRVDARASAASRGCAACLRLGLFGFFHITEVGYLDESGLTTYQDEEQSAVVRVFAVDESGSAMGETKPRPPAPPGPTVGEAAIDELRRTPDFSTWNEVGWGVHCDDFMAYLGVWGPSDFEKARSGVQGRTLFLDSIDREHAELWPDGDDAPEWGALCIHVFECLGCGTLRAVADYT